MSKYKLGDRVRLTGPGWQDTFEHYIGEVVTVDYITDYDSPRTADGYVLDAGEEWATEPANDDVNHPSHYTSYKGIEVIQLTEQMNFNRGNAVKYTARAGLKNPDTEVQDLEKAVWYLQREIQRIKDA
jgi:hypothetical protein